MKIEIKCAPDELAALVVALQERRAGEVSLSSAAGEIFSGIESAVQSLINNSDRTA